VFSQFSQTRVPQFSPQALWDHSMGVAVLAKRISITERLGAKAAEESFTAGLLHDAGKLVLAANLPDWFNDALDLARADRLTISEAERHVFGATHAEVGAYLLGLWGLPENVVEAVAFHHQPALSGARQPGALLAVHAANTLEHEPRAAANHRQPQPSPLEQPLLAQLGLADRVVEWRKLRVELLEEIA
ncbi:MAG: HDOD domain-containing protein, partial [Pyrinomonadaceae bacterium]